jgi:hypothetical protein
LHQSLLLQQDLQQEILPELLLLLPLPLLLVCCVSVAAPNVATATPSAAPAAHQQHKPRPEQGSQQRQLPAANSTKSCMYTDTLKNSNIREVIINDGTPCVFLHTVWNQDCLLIWSKFPKL